MPIYVAIIIGIVLALGGTVAAYIFFIPESKRATFNNNKFLLFLHDTFNFKSLWLETILRALYVFSTLSCVGAGFFMLFSGQSSYNYYSGRSSFHSFALSGLLVMILGPIAVRITYESLMMFILLVKNTMEINKKLGSKTVGSPEAEEPDEVPAAPPAPPRMVYCAFCGTRYDANSGDCPRGCRP